MRLFRVACFSLGVPLPVVLAVACNQDTPDPPTLGTMANPPPSIGIITPGANSDAGTVDGGCTTTITNEAPIINEQYVGETEPVALGGTLVGGTYYLTAANLYTGIGGNAGPTGLAAQETFALNTANGTYEDLVAETVGDAGVVESVATTGSFSTIGTTFTLTSTCPSSASASDTYSVINSTIHVYQGQLELIYTLQ